MRKLFSGWRRSSSERHQSSNTNFIMALCSIRDGAEIASVIPALFQNQLEHDMQFLQKKTILCLKNNVKRKKKKKTVEKSTG